MRRIGPFSIKPFGFSASEIASKKAWQERHLHNSGALLQHMHALKLTSDGSKIIVDRKYWPRSRYMPHIGKKQLAKAAARQAKESSLTTEG